MIYFWTDHPPGERDILAPVKDLALVIKDIDDSPIYVVAAPPGGWTHSLLDTRGRTLLERLVSRGANAFLGTVCVGTTEA